MKTEKELLLNNIRNILVDVEDSLSIDDIIISLNRNNIMNITKEKTDKFEKLLDSNRHLYGIVKSDKKTYKVKNKERNTGIDPFYTEKHYEQYKLTGDKNLFTYLIDDIITNEFKNDPNFNKIKFEERYNKICKERPRSKREFIFSCIDKRLYWKLDEISPSLEKYSNEDKELFRIKFKKDMKLLSNVQALKKPYVPKSDHIEDVINNCREYISYGMMYHDEYKNASKKIKDTIKEKYKNHEIFKSQQFGEIPTSIRVCERLLDKYNPKDWGNPYIKWIDMCVGTGPFLICLIRRLLKGLSNYCGLNPNTGEVLDLRTEGARYKWIIENMIYACEIQPINIFIWMFFADPYDQYKLNVYLGSSIEDHFLNHVRTVWDIKSSKDVRVLGNPPYNAMIDLKFIEMAYKIADNVLFIHPSTWLLDEKNRQSKFTKTKELVADSLDNIELLNGNNEFGIGLFAPLSITHIIKNRTKKGIVCVDTINKVKLTYDNIWQINKFSNNDIYFKLKEKITNDKYQNLHDILLKDNGSNWYVNLSQIRGHVSENNDSKMVQDDFYTLCTKDLKASETPRQQREKTQASFLTKEEADNFIEYVKTNFVRFCLSINKNNQNLYCGEMSLIPWLDYTEKWDDEKLNKLFNLTEEEIEFINKFIPKYY